MAAFPTQAMDGAGAPNYVPENWPPARGPDNGPASSMKAANDLLLFQQRPSMYSSASAQRPEYLGHPEPTSLQEHHPSYRELRRGDDDSDSFMSASTSVQGVGDWGAADRRGSIESMHSASRRGSSDSHLTSSTLLYDHDRRLSRILIPPPSESMAGPSGSPSVAGYPGGQIPSPIRPVAYPKGGAQMSITTKLPSLASLHVSSPSTASYAAQHSPSLSLPSPLNYPNGHLGDLAPYRRGSIQLPLMRRPGSNGVDGNGTSEGLPAYVASADHGTVSGVNYHSDRFGVDRSSERRHSAAEAYTTGVKRKDSAPTLSDLISESPAKRRGSIVDMRPPGTPNSASSPSSYGFNTESPGSGISSGSRMPTNRPSDDHRNRPLLRVVSTGCLKPSRPEALSSPGAQFSGYFTSQPGRPPSAGGFSSTPSQQPFQREGLPFSTPPTSSSSSPYTMSTQTGTNGGSYVSVADRDPTGGSGRPSLHHRPYAPTTPSDNFAEGSHQPQPLSRVPSGRRRSRAQVLSPRDITRFSDAASFSMVAMATAGSQSQATESTHSGPIATTGATVAGNESLSSAKDYAFPPARDAESTTVGAPASSHNAQPLSAGLRSSSADSPYGGSQSTEDSHAPSKRGASAGQEPTSPVGEAGPSGTGASASASSMHPLNPATPYARTPELRVTHKLAERKRRKEIKDLFDELKDILPQDSFRAGKTSKWEILSKAVEHIEDLHTIAHERDNLRAEVATLRSGVIGTAGDHVPSTAPRRPQDS
ncbi:hypothetical protein HK405_009142 [Cladochytrium tenue]|nr:hypothetical protein HK405_009142 [Cladochytrium tenue]